MHKPRIGLALGSGSARGWAHIGVIRALEGAGIRPDLVCGTSIGALVGAAYAAGELDRFEDWVLGMGVRDVLALMDVRLGGGMLKGERLMDYFRRNFVDRPIEELSTPFGAVATALHTGAEVWLREGSTVEAVRASIALPALFAPAVYEGRVIVDGGLVNPVPVSLARAMGADIVIAVDLSADMLGRHLRSDAKPEEPAGLAGQWLRRLQNGLGKLRAPSSDAAVPRPPSLLEVVTASINVMQVRITRSRMAGDPPEVVVAPRLAHLGVLDFHRGQEAIEEGRRAGLAGLEALQALGIPGSGAPAK
ncbi:MAG: patatin-like phospholipase RssA [Betaproteobacteria bacterium]|nr:patatin-like phospholipase RssA [Betaproteobacteria bacterium]